MGLVITLKIAELDDNRMFLKRSRFPKAMGSMLLGLSLIFFVMYNAASVYLMLLFNSTSIMDKIMFFAIISLFISFPVMGLFLIFYDKRIIADKSSGEVRIYFRLFFIPFRKIRIPFAKIDEILIENICKSKTVAMLKAKEAGKPIRAGHWLMSLRGKELRKRYFDRNPKKEEILSYAENLSRLTSKKVVMVQ